jgi:hypothetical protein
VWVRRLISWNNAVHTIQLGAKTTAHTQLKVGS